MKEILLNEHLHDFEMKNSRAEIKLQRFMNPSVMLTKDCIVPFHTLDDLH